MKTRIVNAITELMEFDGNEMFQKSRKQYYVESRQMTYYFLRKELGWTLTQIADFFQLNHATIIHGVDVFGFRLSMYEESEYLYIRFKAALGITNVNEKELLSSFIFKNESILSEDLKKYLKAVL